MVQNGHFLAEPLRLLAGRNYEPVPLKLPRKPSSNDDFEDVSSY